MARKGERERIPSGRSSRFVSIKNFQDGVHMNHFRSSTMFLVLLFFLAASVESSFIIVIDAGSSGSRIHIFEAGSSSMPPAEMSPLKLPQKQKKERPGSKKCSLKLDFTEENRAFVFRREPRSSGKITAGTDQFCKRKYSRKRMEHDATASWRNGRIAPFVR